jgi:hypothetical protein
MLIISQNLSYTEKYYLIRKEILKIIDGSNNAQSINSKINHKSISINEKFYKIKDLIIYYTKFLNGYDCNLSERFYYIYHDIHNVITCKECQVNKPNFQNWTLGYREFCSIRCSNLNKDTQEKRKQTCFGHYGVEHQLNSPEIKNKLKETIKKHNNQDPFRLNRIQNKYKKTSLERYGFENAAQSKKIHGKSVINKRKNFFENVLTQKEFLNEFEMLFTFEEYKGTAKQKYKFKHKKCGCIFNAWIKDGQIPKCPKCSPPNNQSQYEIEIRKFLTEYTNNIITNSKSIIQPYELDIYLPDYNLAIEFNGIYWHGESQGKDQYYHIDKSKKCWEKKINLIHIFEDEWNNKSQILQSMILERINKSPWEINGRKCRIKKVSNIDRDKFLEKHHIQGKVQSSCRQLHNYGLFYNDYLVSLLVLEELKINNVYKYEICRFCNYIGTSINYGFNILLDYIINDLNNNNIVVHTDLRFDTGRIYKDYGFKYVGRIEPTYYYIQTGNKPKRINQNNIDTCSSFDYDIIWDCGQAIFEI